MATPARQAAALSGSLALPPGPLGMLTVLPDLYVIWKTQRQMVADIFGVCTGAAPNSPRHMLYCLFRHAASHVLRDVAVRTGQRVIVQQLTAGALKGIMGKLGVTVTRRVVGTAASRWVPLAGAAAVGAFVFSTCCRSPVPAHRLLAAPGEDGAR